MLSRVYWEKYLVSSYSVLVIFSYIMFRPLLIKVVSIPLELKKETFWD